MVGCGSVTPAGLLKALEGTSSQEPRGSAASTGVASPDSGRGDLRPVVQAGDGSEAGVTDGHVSTETEEGWGVGPGFWDFRWARHTLQSPGWLSWEAEN